VSAPAVTGRPSRPSGARRRVSGSITFRAPELADFDLLSTRDLAARRIWKGRVRNFARLVTLVTGDIIVLSAVSWVVLRLLGSSDAEWALLLPRVLVLGILGQASARPYTVGRRHAGLTGVAFGAILTGSSIALFDAIYGLLRATTPGPHWLTLGFVVGLSLWRLAVAMGLRAAYARSIGCRRVLIVADRQHADDVIERFKSAREPHIRVAGYVEANGLPNASALGTLGEFNHLLEEHNIDAVIISAHLPEQAFRRVVHTCFVHAVGVTVVPSTLTEIPSRVSSRDLLGMPMLELEPPTLHVFQVNVKRATDIIIGSIVLTLLSPLMLLVAIAIRLESRGPILFRQYRPGLGGKVFPMLKFRTMRADAEAALRADPALYQRYLDNDCKLPVDEDPRVSRLGRFLRASSIDELPQLFNVMRGDMSLIGPRPVVGPELRHYGEWKSIVLGVRPGMTGWWQVAGRSHIQGRERAHLDIYYVKQWSLALDLKILLMTLPAVLRRSGAF
jgi:exopolysaccharide biosynthesis polyprenyl glycosylphosphotransferase